MIPKLGTSRTFQKTRQQNDLSEIELARDLPQGEPAEIHDDVVPLLSRDGFDDRLRSGATGVHPIPSCTYTCSDGRSWASKLMFSWIWPTIEKSRGGKQLDLEDSLLLPEELTAGALSDRFQQAWMAAVAHGNPSLASVLRALHARDLFVSGLYRFVTEMCKATAPMLLQELILYVKGEPKVVPVTFLGGLAIATLMFLVVLVQAFSLQLFIFGVFVTGAEISTTATVAVYDKALRLSRRSLEGPRLGQALNFQAKDASMLREFIVFLHNLWAAPLAALVCTVLLLYVLGYSAFVGVALIPLLIPLETWVAKRSSAYRKSVLKVSDARISLIGEIIDGIKTVKLVSLEAAFRDRVEALRENELGSIRRALTLKAYNQAVMRSSPIAVALATFAAYSLSGHELDAQTAFTALALFGTIGHPFRVIPKAVQLLADARVSIKRLEAFLLEHETERAENFIIKSPSTREGGGDVVPPRIELQDAAFGPVAGTTCIEHATARISGGLSVLVGPVGSGKTSLLAGLVEHLPPAADDVGLGDDKARVVEKLKAHAGSVKIETGDGRIAYCPDNPWIVNASARDNICIGSTKAFDEARYLKCVEACALEQDFAQWPQRDESIIGAKGITISGGQKARIALARAAYAGCSVVVLDDPLAALDNIIGSWVFKNAVQGMMAQRGAAVLMATHQLQYLREGVDCHVFVVDRGALRFERDAHNIGLKAVTKGGSPLDAATSSEGVLGDDRTSSRGSPREGGSMQRLSKQVDADRQKGGVSARVYVDYMKACGLVVVIVALAISVAAQFVDISKEVVLAFWSDSTSGSSGFYLACYAVVSLLVVAMNVARFFVVFWLGLRGSRSLHKSLLHKVMGAPLPFFQVTENGRITSRFSADFDAIDLSIPSAVASSMDAALAVLAAVAVVVGTSPLVLLFILPIGVIYHRIQNAYRNAAKELKRLDSATKSPVYSHFQETLDGLSSIQAYKIEQSMRERNLFLVDANMRARLTWDAANRWLGIRLDALGSFILYVAALMAVFAGKMRPGIVGLGMSSALAITRSMSLAVRSSTALENTFNAVERVSEFIGVAQEEADGEQGEGERPLIPAAWPCRGVEICDIHARHRKDLPAVLTGVSLSVRCGERVGICGRSGSGKSSLALALVRVVECFRGTIKVDGINVANIPLARLREGVTLISQDAHLFSGNVREVVDPLEQCSDTRIWDILEMVGMKDTVASLPLGLQTSVTERGNNWSQGQRQLLCIARAMVHQPGVLVFDESTANVDMGTDRIIQQVIRSRLNQAAVIVIAHRLEDVVSCHQVVVMDAGVIAERGTPSELLGNSSSMLSRLARELGPEIERRLREEHARVSVQ